MENFLAFSDLNSLLSYLNIIFIGIVVFFAINKFNYFRNVIIYAIAKTFIPIITSLIYCSFLGVNITFSIGTIFILLIRYFILGLVVIKIIEKITNYFDSDTIVYFIFAFSIIDSIASWLFSIVINLLI